MVILITDGRQLTEVCGGVYMLEEGGICRDLFSYLEQKAMVFTSQIAEHRMIHEKLIKVRAAQRWACAAAALWSLVSVDSISVIVKVCGAVCKIVEEGTLMISNQRVSQGGEK